MRLRMLLPLFLLSAAPAAAQDAPPGRYFYDTGQFYDMCTGNDPQGQHICFGYVAATADSVTFYGHTEHRCIAAIPTEMKIDAVRDRVVALLKQHPEVRQFSAFAQVTFALEHAFRCQG